MRYLRVHRPFALAFLVSVCLVAWSLARAETKPADDGTLFYLSCDDASRTSDESGRDVAVEIHNVDVVPGRVGKAFYFDGQGGFLRLSGDVLPAGGDFTLEAWFRLSVSPMILWAGYQPGVRVVASGAARMRLSIADDAKQVFMDTPVAFDDGYWHHLALIVRRDRSATLYVDATPAAHVGTEEGAGQVRFPDEIYIGGWPRWSKSKGEWMMGALDEIRITAGARPLADIFTECATGEDGGPSSQ